MAASDDGATFKLRGRPNEFRFRRFELRVTDGFDRGASCASDGPEVGLGTGQGNQLVLTDRTVSAHHCAVSATPAGYLLRDLDSTNGTSVGGLGVVAAYLQPGMELRLGTTTIRFDTLGDEVREPLS